IARNISVSDFVVVGGTAPELPNFINLNSDEELITYARSILKDELSGATPEDDQMQVGDEKDCDEVDDVPAQRKDTVRKCFTWLGGDRYEGQTLVEFTLAQGPGHKAAGVDFALTGGNF